MILYDIREDVDMTAILPVISFKRTEVNLRLLRHYTKYIMIRKREWQVTLLITNYEDI